MKNKMYLKFFTVLVAMAIGFATTTTGQTLFTIGDSTTSSTSTSYPTPYGDFYKTMRTQFLYLADEMVAAGMGAGDITEITFWVGASASEPGLTEGVTVSMMNTASTTLAAGAWEAGASVVWGPYDNDPTAGAWNTFVFDTPFYWDGTSNIVVEICGGSDLGGWTYNGIVALTTGLDFNGSRTYRTDGATEGGICSYTGTSESGTVTSRPVIRFMAAEGEACTGTPDAGSASASAVSVCADELFTVSVAPVLAGGITYQWEVSIDGSSWSAIAGAVSTSYSTTQSAASWYRCIVTCTASGESSTSLEVFVDQNDPLECYCTPYYSSGTSGGDYCSYVGLGDISNATDGAPAPYYTYYDTLATDLTTGVEYGIIVASGSYGSSNGFAVWIDYNQNGSFYDEGDLLGNLTITGSFTSDTIYFTVPLDATPGTTRLRVREVWAMGTPDPCADASYGETEDYNVNIVGGETCDPVPPTDLYVDGITATGATFHWTPAPGADVTRIVLWELSTGDVHKYLDYGGDVFTVPGELTPSTTYGVRMRSGCTGEESVRGTEFTEWYYFTTASLRTGEFTQSVGVYPNPNDGNFRIQLNGYESGKAQVMIMNSVGQLVYEASVSVDSNVSVHDVSLRLAAGTYFVKVINGADIVTSSVIVE